MGCGCSSIKNESRVGVTSTTSSNSGGVSVTQGKLTSQNLELMEAAKKRRSNQTMVENMVTENYTKDISQFYKIDAGTILGEGISGSVRMCSHIETGLPFALKSLDKTKLKSSAVDKLREEIRIMAKLDHPNIIRLHEVFEDAKKIHLVVELCTGGELLDRLHKQEGHHYTEKVACGYIRQMLSALNYCHENNIAHRDLKLENFLFESEQPDAQLKLIDFGLSQHFEKNELILNPVGTPYYVAPEVLNGAYDNRCDIWSLGVITYMLISGTPPFYGKNDVETLRAVKVGKLVFDEKLFKPVSLLAKDFISSCLTKNVAKRPNAKSLLQHDWFKILNNDIASPSLNVLVRLKAFDKKSSLAKICMEVIAHTLNTEQISALRRQFQLLDKGNTGEVTIADLKTILSKQGAISAANMEHMFTPDDDENTNKIKYHEFLAATLSRQNLTENNLKVAFDKISNHGNKITSDDLKNLLGKEASDEEIMSMMKEANLNSHEEGISYSAFKAIMKGGEASPMVNSPFNKYRKKLSFGPDGQAIGNSDEKRRNYERKASGNATPLHRLAMNNRASNSPYNGGDRTPDSPQYPQQLNFSDKGTPVLSPLAKTAKVEPEEVPDLIPPPPCGPPPSP